MNNFGKHWTPKQAKNNGDSRSLKTLEKLARSNATCSNCDEKAWKWAGAGLCFSCTTGEADASNDIELKAG